MRRFKRFALAIVLLLLILLVVVFVLENREPASLVFLGWTFSQLPLAAYVILALLLGMVVGPVLTWLVGLRVRHRS